MLPMLPNWCDGISCRFTKFFCKGPFTSWNSSIREFIYTTFIPKPEASLTSIEILLASQSTIKEEADKYTLEEAKGPDITLGEVEQDSGAQISDQFVPMDDVYSPSSLRTTFGKADGRWRKF